jgi:cbb3-type cytochrome oxidase subunit 3
MFREFLGSHAPEWIGMLTTWVTVFSAIAGLLIAWYVLTDRRRTYQARMSAMPLDDGAPVAVESHHV